MTDRSLEAQQIEGLSWLDGAMRWAEEHRVLAAVVAVGSAGVLAACSGQTSAESGTPTPVANTISTTPDGTETTIPTVHAPSPDSDTPSQQATSSTETSSSTPSRSNLSPAPTSPPNPTTRATTPTVAPKPTAAPGTLEKVINGGKVISTLTPLGEIPTLIYHQKFILPAVRSTAYKKVVNGTESLSERGDDLTKLFRLPGKPGRDPERVLTDFFVRVGDWVNFGSGFTDKDEINLYNGPGAYIDDMLSVDEPIIKALGGPNVEQSDTALSYFDRYVELRKVQINQAIRREYLKSLNVPETENIAAGDTPAAAFIHDVASCDSPNPYFAQCFVQSEVVGVKDTKLPYTMLSFKYDQEGGWHLVDVVSNVR